MKEPERNIPVALVILTIAIVLVVLSIVATVVSGIIPQLLNMM